MEGKPQKVKNKNQLVFILGKVKESLPDLPEVRMLGHHLKQGGQGSCTVRHRAEGHCSEPQGQGPALDNCGPAVKLTIWVTQQQAKLSRGRLQ